jgi:hypothetical protein
LSGGFEQDPDYRLTDIVAERYDAGVRRGETAAPGMIAVRIAPDMRKAVVGSCGTQAADGAAGSDGAQLHQSASANPWRALCLGIRKR